MTDWHRMDDPAHQPPKDGTLIDAWAVSSFSPIGYRIVDVMWGRYDWAPRSAPEEWLTLRRDDGEPFRDRWQPIEGATLTHWMHRPPPPVTP